MLPEKFDYLGKKSTEEIIQDTEALQKVFDEVFRWENEDKELAQTRSNFQIEKFIALDHHTIPSAFHSLLKNRRSMAEALLQKIVEMQEHKREFDYKWENNDRNKPIKWHTRDGGTKLCWYDLDYLNYQNFLKSCEIEIIDRVQQLDFFDKLLHKMIELNNGPISKEQFEEEDHIYWERRFANQAMDQILASKTGIDTGNLHSMRRATAPTIVSDDRYRIKNPFPDLLKAMNPGPDQMEFVMGLQKKVLEGIHDVTGTKFDDLTLSNNAVNKSIEENTLSPKELLAKSQNTNK